MFYTSINSHMYLGPVPLLNFYPSIGLWLLSRRVITLKQNAQFCGRRPCPVRIWVGISEPPLIGEGSKDLSKKFFNNCFKICLFIY